MNTRPLRFFIGYLVKKHLVYFPFGLLYCLLMGFLNSSAGSTWESKLVYMAYLFIFVEAGLVIILGNMYGEIVVPLCIGFGATRKDTFKSQQVCNAVLVVCLMAIDILLVAAVFAFIGGGSEAVAYLSEYIPFFLGALFVILLFCVALNQLGTALFVTVGGKALIWFRLGFLFLGIISCVAIGLVAAIRIQSLIGNYRVLGVSFAVDALLYAGGFVWLKKSLARYRLDI